MKDNKKDTELLNYKSKLNKNRKDFQDYLGSCNRYLQNKRLKDIKYYG